MTLHDAGPWLGRDEHGRYKATPNWTAICNGLGFYQYAPIWAGDKVVALVVGSSGETFGTDPAFEANAALIAAAPDLLAALKLLEAEGFGERPKTAEDLLRMDGIAVIASTAIAKAEGGAA